MLAVMGKYGRPSARATVGQPQHDRHRLFGTDDGDGDHRDTGPHGDLDEATAPEAAELVAVGERLGRPLGALGKDQRQLLLLLQEPVGVGGASRDAAGARPQGPDDGHGPEEVVGQSVDGSPELLLDPVHDDRRVGGDGAGMVGDEQRAALGRDLLRAPPTPYGTTWSRSGS